jgi:hypothetical protein
VAIDQAKLRLRVSNGDPSSAKGMLWKLNGENDSKEFDLLEKSQFDIKPFRFLVSLWSRLLEHSTIDFHGKSCSRVEQL